MCPLENHKNSDLDTPHPSSTPPQYIKGHQRQSLAFRFENFSVSKLFDFFLMISVSVLENFGIEKSIGIGFENFGIKKSIGFKKFDIEKVSDSENTFEETRNHLKNIYIKG